MNVGLVRRGYSASGGAERYLLRFAQGLVHSGHDWCLFSDADWPEDLIAQHGGSLQKLRRCDSPRAFADVLQKARPREKCDCLFSLERVHDCDVYRAGDGVHAAWLDRRARIEGKGLASWWRNHRRKHREILALESRLYAADSGPDIITNSQLVRREIIARYHTPGSRLHCITNGYDAPARTDSERASLRESKRSELGLETKEIAVLFTGSGWERKGLATAIAAVDAMRGGSPKITLLVAGSGKLKGAGLGQNNAAIRLLGPVAAGQMTAVYEASDLFVLPTLYDPFSNASLEAAAHGLPVITTPANGFSEILPDDHSLGTVVPEAEITALAAAIATWASASPADRARDRQTIREWASRWSVERNVSETLAVLERACADRRNSIS